MVLVKMESEPHPGGERGPSQKCSEKNPFWQLGKLGVGVMR